VAARQSLPGRTWREYGRSLTKAERATPCRLKSSRNCRICSNSPAVSFCRERSCSTHPRRDFRRKVERVGSQHRLVGQDLAGSRHVLQATMAQPGRHDPLRQRLIRKFCASVLSKPRWGEGCPTSVIFIGNRHEVAASRARPLDMRRICVQVIFRAASNWILASQRVGFCRRLAPDKAS